MRPLAAVLFLLAALVALVLWLGRGETAAPTGGHATGRDGNRFAAA